MNVYRTTLASLALLIPAPLVRAQTTTYLPRMEHRFEGLVTDAFMSDDGQLTWTCEDGGRIRFRDGTATSPHWVYQVTEDLAQSTLRAIHFVPDATTHWSVLGNLVGWTVGDDGFVFKTEDGGVTWSTRAWAPPNPVGSSPYGHLRDIYFIDKDVGWLVGLHGIWKSTQGGVGWTPVTLLDQSGSPINPADIELYAVDVLDCTGSAPIIVACGEPGIVLRSVPPSGSVGVGEVMEVVWDMRDRESEVTGCTANPGDLWEAITRTKPPPVRFELWDIEFQRKCTGGDPLLIVVGGGFGGAAFSSTDYGSTFVRECHECDGFPPPCSGNSDYELNTSVPTHYYRNQSFLELYGVAVFGDGSAVAGGYGGQHVVRGTNGVWVDRSQFGPFALHVDDPADPAAVNGASLMLLNGAVCQRDSGSTSTNGNALVVGQGGQGRSTDNAALTPSSPPYPAGQPPENWTDELPAGWWRMHATAFSTFQRGWRTGQNYHIARTEDGGVTWTRETVLPYGYNGSFASIAVSPTATPTNGSGVAVGEHDDRLYSAGPPEIYGPTLPYQYQPKILRRRSVSSVIDWIEPLSISWLSPSGAPYQSLNDVTWAATVSSGDVYWACGTGGTILSTTDGGDTWTQEPPAGGAASHTFNALAFMNQDEGVFVGRHIVSGKAAAYALRLTTGGRVWDNVSPSTAGPGVIELYDVALDGTTAYAVGSVPSGSSVVGKVFSASLTGTPFSALTPLTSQPVTSGVAPCDIGDALGTPPLSNIAVATNGDLWVGGECGRVWRRDHSTGNWQEIKSQTDGHILNLASAPSDYVYAVSMRQNRTGPGLVRWKP